VQIIYVDSDLNLATAITLMAKETTYLAIDTEFRREDTYFPQLCLIQVATSDCIFLIDAIKILDITPFFSILTNPNILKVFHSGRQDLEIFCHLMQGTVTRNVFDTQIAAMLAGYGESAGFESLVSKLLNVSLDKSSRHTDWTKRPLAEEQKTYAINDVLYLRPLYELIITKLIQKDRQDWIKDEVSLLESADFLITVPKQAWRKLNTSHFSSRSLYLVQKLTEWREDTAQRMNIPRSWLLKDEVILDLSLRKYASIESLKKIPHFPKEDPIVLEEVWDILQKVLNTLESELPAIETLRTLSKAEQNILDALKLLLKITADQLSLNPKLIAEKEDLIKWMTGDPSWHPKGNKKGWRARVFWEKAQDLVDGKLKLHVHKGQLKIE
jgi:ribonuclease D